MVSVHTSENQAVKPSCFIFGELIPSLKENQTYLDEAEVLHPQKYILGKYSRRVVPKQL